MPINRTSHPQGRGIEGRPTLTLAETEIGERIEKREREKGD